jgi:hypothetical protein
MSAGDPDSNSEPPETFRRTKRRVDPARPDEVAGASSTTLVDSAVATPHRSLLARLYDFVFGFDYFLSHRWSDAHPYATQLAAKLEPEFHCFLDSKDFAKGLLWSVEGERALARTSILILVLSPTVFASQPVLDEVLFFQKRKPANRLIVIDPGGLFEAAPADHPLIEAIGMTRLRIGEPADALTTGPSAELIETLRQDFDLVKQDTRRARVLAGAVAVLSALLIAALIAAWYATQQQRLAEKALSREASALREKNQALELKLLATAQREETLQRAGQRLLAEGRAHWSRGHWALATLAFGRALQFQPGDAEIGAELWRALLVHTGDRLDLPDEIIPLPRNAQVLSLAADPPLALLTEGRVDEKHQNLTHWDLGSARGTKPFPFGFSVRMSGDGKWLASPRSAGSAEWGWDIYELAEGRLSSGRAMPAGWYPASEIGGDAHWRRDALLLQNPDGSVARWWNIRSWSWDGPEIGLAKGAYVVQVSPDGSRIFWWAYQPGWQLYAEATRTHLDLGLPGIVTPGVVISMDGRRVVARSPGAHPSRPGDVETISDRRVLPDLMVTTLQHSEVGVFRSISHSGRFALEDDRAGNLRLRDFDRRERKIWGKAGTFSTLRATLAHEPRWIFHPRREELWHLRRGACAIYKLPAVLPFQDEKAAPPPPAVPPGESIHRFLELVQEPLDVDAVLRACAERDRLRIELNDGANFRDLPDEWRRLLKWWTAKPSERTSF